MMFDQELMVNGTVDLDIAAVWAAACNRASDLMAQARTLDMICGSCRENTPGHVWCSYRLQRRLARDMARQIMFPFRRAIAERTEQETRQARGMVLTGNVAGMTSVPATIMCPDCERPLWQHLLLFGTRTLCPFGREYWTHMRAHRAQNFGEARACDDPMLQMIARPNRVKARKIEA